MTATPPSALPSHSILTMLRATTRTRLFVPPAGWCSQHLDLLHVQISDSPLPPPPPSAALRRAFPTVGDKLDCYMRELGPDMGLTMLLSELWGFSDLFRSFSPCPGSSRRLSFRFAGRSCDLFDAIVITRHAGPLALPVLSYLDRVTIAKIRSESRSRARLALDAQLDPYEFAVLVAMAQKQHAELSKLRCPRQSYTTHLLGCIPSPRAPRFVLFTATIPAAFLRCLAEPDVPLSPADAPTISRHIISRKTTGTEFLDIIYGALAAGPFMGQPEWREATRRVNRASRAETAATSKKRSADQIEGEEQVKTRPTKRPKRTADDRRVHNDHAAPLKPNDAIAEECSQAVNTPRTWQKITTSVSDIREDKENTAPPDTIPSERRPPVKLLKRSADEDCVDTPPRKKTKAPPTNCAHPLGWERQHSPDTEPTQHPLPMNAMRPANETRDAQMRNPGLADVALRRDARPTVAMKAKRTAAEMSQGRETRHSHTREAQVRNPGLADTTLRRDTRATVAMKAKRTAGEMSQRTETRHSHTREAQVRNPGLADVALRRVTRATVAMKAKRTAGEMSQGTETRHSGTRHRRRRTC
ncbi:hypothetical protein FN846DRAFT_266013 [Sphaerosporella brunnea]|uniref:Uncharacterized protein n=1 Tax=Sphaerosporella brunnea TaxID=1250544 RepID=A0A5J5EMY4_9PEZI|nr:hypothetical protein FN846DRAFT_266013 [Sphaerosporella brunnea]